MGIQLKNLNIIVYISSALSERSVILVKKDATKLEVPRHLAIWFWPQCVLWTAPMGGSFPTLFTSLNCRIHCHGALWSSARVEQLQLAQVCWWHLSSEQSVGVIDTDGAFGSSFGNTPLGHNYLGMHMSRICNKGWCSGGKRGTGLRCYIRARLYLNWNSGFVHQQKPPNRLVPVMLLWFQED